MAVIKTFWRIYKFRLNYDGMGRIDAARHAVRAVHAIHFTGYSL
ncbi:hypothetical protein Micant_00013 [Erwinia phage Micant]|uniref:Uncharacterized protein n=1 Tax=Erwinia phage Micant TaxID=2923255 RepID=A0AAE9FNL6_9CAUD|nr:hypothetical protein Micant_00013 [Erwinia phage Micant]